MRNLKPSQTDTHKVTCIDGTVREKPYKYFDCVHCHWHYWVHYQQKMPYTVCAVCSDDKQERDCKYINNPFKCDYFKIKERG